MFAGILHLKFDLKHYVETGWRECFIFVSFPIFNLKKKTFSFATSQLLKLALTLKKKGRYDLYSFFLAKKNPWCLHYPQCNLTIQSEILMLVAATVASSSWPQAENRFWLQISVNVAFFALHHLRQFVRFSLWAHKTTIKHTHTRVRSKT